MTGERWVGLLFVTIGIVMASVSTWLHLAAADQTAAAAQWPTVAGSIVESHLSTTGRSGGRRRGGSSYLPRVVYRYEVAGRAYTGTRIWLVINEPFGQRADAEAWLQRHAPGAPVIVHYDPADPSHAALIVDADGSVGILTLIFVGVGLLFVAMGAMVFFLFGRPIAPVPR